MIYIQGAKTRGWRCIWWRWGQSIVNLRIYGSRPFRAAVLHGGPGAPGEMAPVARELAASMGVLEPIQTATSIEGQVRELQAVLRGNGDIPLTLIGWSWGATLAFIFAARHPTFVKKLTLIGSAPFESKYAAGITTTRLNRMGEDARVEFLALSETMSDPATGDKDMLMARLGKLIATADSYDPLPHADETMDCRHDIYQSVWQEASDMRSSGELLALGSKIRCPVTAIHGNYDPHPDAGVREPLSWVLKDFRFILLEKCGHQPWTERHAQERFYQILKEEIG